MLLYQGEILTKEALQLFAQQQLATQLAVVLLAVTIVSGIGLTGFFQIMRSFTKTIGELRESTVNQTKMLREFLGHIEAKIESVEIEGENRDTQIKTMTNEIRSGFNELNGRLDHISEILETNPEEHKDLLNAFLRLERTLERTKQKTDELPDYDKAK